MANEQQNQTNPQINKNRQPGADQSQPKQAGQSGQNDKMADKEQRTFKSDTDNAGKNAGQSFDRDNTRQQGGQSDQMNQSGQTRRADQR